MRGRIALRIPPAQPAGWLRLSLEVRTPSAVDTIDLGWVQIVDYALSPSAAQVQTPLRAQAGELTLLGFSQDGAFARDKDVGLVTHWRANAAPARDGIAFVHVIGPDGALAAQKDSGPLEAGLDRSTQTYRAGAGFDIAHALRLSPDAPAGRYTIYIGIYDRAGFERWPAAQNDAPARDNLIVAGTFELP